MLFCQTAPLLAHLLLSLKMLTDSFSTLHYPNSSLCADSLPGVYNKKLLPRALLRLANVDRLRLISVDGKMLRMALTNAAKHVIWLRSKGEGLVVIWTSDLGWLWAQSVCLCWVNTLGVFTWLPNKLTSRTDCLLAIQTWRTAPMCSFVPKLIAESLILTCSFKAKILFKAPLPISHLL